MTQFESDIFDFDNIPMSELDKAYIDYEPLYDTVDWFSVDEDWYSDWIHKRHWRQDILDKIDIISDGGY